MVGVKGVNIAQDRGKSWDITYALVKHRVS
jgi:hypothetical protein